MKIKKTATIIADMTSREKKKKKKTPIIKLISANHGNQKIKLINLYLTVNVI